jgi:hypothetical protein
LFQGTDQEFERTEDTFLKIARSIRCRGTDGQSVDTGEEDSSEDLEDSDE